MISFCRGTSYHDTEIIVDDKETYPNGLESSFFV